MREAKENKESMIIQAGDLAVEIDTGTNAPGAILQRLEDDKWQDYLRDGKPMTWPVEVDRLEPSRYRVKENPGHR